MTFREGLINARSHIIFILGLATAFGIIIKLETLSTVKTSEFHVAEPEQKARPVQLPTVGRTIDNVAPRALTEQEREWATIAWKYFENNYVPETGLVNSVDRYQASTMWDTASYLLGLISAYRLEIIAREEFDERVQTLLKTLATLPLFDGRLPNKSYNTVSGDMVDYQNRKIDRGIGWSAIDIGRLLVPFNILIWNYPEFNKLVTAVIRNWDWDAVTKGGVMYGAGVDESGDTILVQEGRIGYEEYGAKSFTLLGLDVSQALRYDDFLKYVPVYGIDIPTDSRSPEIYHAHNYVVSESYILDGLEFGWDMVSAEFAWRVYEVQEKRYQDTGIFTAVSEDNIDQAPYFVYNTVFTDGKVWNAITDTGEDASAYKTVSTKAVFGWYALFGTPYTKQLIEQVRSNFDSERGWYAGIYEATGKPNTAVTGNTNAIILESLAYIEFGKLVAVY